MAEFEGPLDLLLSLVEERKLLVNDVSLSTVADDFISYMQKQVAFPVGQAAHFVLVAATLLLLKSRSLLPVFSLSDEEEGDVKDLEFRLGAYQAFRNAVKTFANVSAHLFFGAGARIVDPIFTAPRDLSLDSVTEAAQRVLQNAPQKALAREDVSVKKVISLEEMVSRLTARIENALTMTFRDFSKAHGDPREIVVGFLAMLELVKRGLVLVEQDNSFGDITMSYSGDAKAPRYE